MSKGQHFKAVTEYNKANGTHYTYKQFKEAGLYTPKPKFVAKNPRGPRKPKILEPTQEPQQTEVEPMPEVKPMEENNQDGTV